MKNQFNFRDVIILDKQYVYNGFFKMALYRIQHRRFDGGWSKVLKREILERPDVAVVIPYDPIRDQVVLLHQFRLGVIKGDVPPWQWELVAGVCEYPTETLDELAHRETEEESGLTIDTLLPIMRYWVSPGGTNERVMLYCGIVDASNAGGIWGVASENEDIKVQAFPFEQAVAGIEQGWITNAASIIGLQWLALNRQKLSSEHSSQFNL